MISKLLEVRGMTEIVSEIKKIINDNDIDLYGFAPVERLDESPEDMHPRTILPTAKTVISLGLGITEGVTRMNRASFNKLPSGMYSYMMFGYVLINQRLNEVAYDITRLLEKHSYVTVPIPASPPNNYYNHQGLMSNKHVAVAAGLGEFGWSSLFVNKTYGPRVRLVSILTEAELEPTPLYDGEPICQPEKCGYKCVKVCPVGAISKNEEVSIVIGEKSVKYALIDKWRCMLSFSVPKEDIPDKVTPEDFLSLRDKGDPWKALTKASVGRASTCGKCLSFCPINEKF
jgi:epoxyqueuosine reductase QueG